MYHNIIIVMIFLLNYTDFHKKCNALIYLSLSEFSIGHNYVIFRDITLKLKMLLSAHCITVFVKEFLLISELITNKTNHSISSNIHTSATANKAIHSPQNWGWGVSQSQQEHHKILTKYEAIHPTTVSENNSSSGMLII